MLILKQCLLEIPSIFLQVDIGDLMNRNIKEPVLIKKIKQNVYKMPGKKCSVQFFK